MKKILLFIHIVLVLSCGTAQKDPKDLKDATPAADSQALELKANGKTNQLNTAEDVITAAYGGTNFVPSGLSEKKNLSFNVEAYMASLEKGEYKAFTCRLPSECETKDENQTGSVIFQPYPTGAIDLSAARHAYLAPSLNLQPLTIQVKEVKDEQQAGNPRKTKLVKGTFSGTLAYVQQQADNTWKVMETTAVSGSFNVYCSLH